MMSPNGGGSLQHNQDHLILLFSLPTSNLLLPFTHLYTRFLLIQSLIRRKRDKQKKMDHDKSTSCCCVLDASTYVGFWILKKLLTRGYSVHAAIRRNSIFLCSCSKWFRFFGFDVRNAEARD